MTVGARAGQRQEHAAGCHCPRVEFDGAGDSGRAAASAGVMSARLTADDVGDLGDGQIDHLADPQRLQRPGQLLTIVERPRLAVTGLPGFVALARDENDVTRSRPGDRVVDGFAAVADLDDFGRAVRGTGDDRGPDGGGILVARVVVGDHHQVGKFRGDAAHMLSLARVPVAARAEDHRQPSGALVAQRLQHRLQRARLVRVVDQGEELLSTVDGLQPARHVRRAQSRRGLLG